MTANAFPVRLDLHTKQEVTLIRSILTRHIRKSSAPGMASASATVARRILRRLEQQSPPQPPQRRATGSNRKEA